MRRTLAATLLVLSASACSGSTPAAAPTVTVTAAPVTVTVTPEPTLVPTFAVAGTLELSDADSAAKDAVLGSCAGKGGYTDIGPGAQVTVYDESAKVLGSGVLGDGVPGSLTCTFSFSITDIPTGATFYQVEVVHRGKLTETPEQMTSPLALTLGS